MQKKFSPTSLGTNWAEYFPDVSIGITCTGIIVLFGDKTWTLREPIVGSHSIINFAGLSTDTLSSLDKIMRAVSLIVHVNGEPINNNNINDYVN